MNNQTKRIDAGSIRNALLVLLLLCGGSVAAFAQQAGSSTPQGSISVSPQGRELRLASLAKISMSDAINAATQANPNSTAVGAELTTENGSLVYDVQLLGPSARSGMKTVVVDAGNANVLGTFTGNAEADKGGRGEYRGQGGYGGQERGGDTESAGGETQDSEGQG